MKSTHICFSYIGLKYFGLSLNNHLYAIRNSTAVILILPLTDFWNRHMSSILKITRKKGQFAQHYTWIGSIFICINIYTSVNDQITQYFFSTTQIWMEKVIKLNEFSVICVMEGNSIWRGPKRTTVQHQTTLGEM